MGLSARPNMDKKFYSQYMKMLYRLEKEKEANKVFKTSKIEQSEKLI